MLEKIVKNATLLNKILNLVALMFVIVFCITVKNFVTIINADISLFNIGDSLKEQMLNIVGWYTYIGNNELDVTILFEQHEIKTAVIISQAFALVNFSLLIIPFYSLKMILSSMINGNPFESGISKHVLELGYGQAIFQIFASFSTGFAQTLCMIFIDGWYRRGVEFSLNPIVFFTLFICSTLAYIFKYGELLQTESDETI